MDQATRDRAYISVIEVAVPPNTEWQPKAAQQFITGLFSISELLKLVISGTDQGIGWSIEAGWGNEEAVKRTIYATYPQAQVDVRPKAGCHIGYWLFQIHAGGPFVFPLKYAEDFDSVDPLALVIEAMANVGPDEEVVYELCLTSPKQNYFELGEKLLTKSVVGVMDYTSLSGAIAATTAKARGADRVDGYVPEISEMARVKLNSRLMEATFGIKIKTASRDRAFELAFLFSPALDSLYREKFNALTSPDRDTHSLVLSAKEVAALWHLPTERCQTPGIVWASGVASALPRQLLQKPAGPYITLGVNQYRGQTQPVRLAYVDRVTHVNIIGKTRVGKSTLIHRMIHQDIETDQGVAVIDPHGDLIQSILATSIPKDRERDVVLLDIRDQDYPIGLNLLSSVPGLSDEAVAGQVLTALKKLFDYWSSRIEDALYAAIRALVSYPGATVEDIPRIFTNDELRHRVLSQLGGTVDVGFWEEYEVKHPMVRDEISSPITSRIRKFYRDPIIRRMVCQQTCLDVSHILNTRKIFLVNLGGGVDVSDIDTFTIGAMLIAKLQLAAMSRVRLSPAERTPYYLYIDEVQNFVTTSLSKMFSEVGKYGLNLVVANQFLDQLRSATGDTLEAILGNVGTSIIFRVGTPDDKALAPFVEPGFTNQDLLNLDRFHAVVKMQAGGKTLDAFSMMTLPQLPPYDDVVDRIAQIRNQSRATYARPATEVDEELKWRSRPGGQDQPKNQDLPKDDSGDNADDSKKDWRDDLAG